MAEHDAFIQRLAAQLLAGELNVTQFQQELQGLACAELPEATLDLQRAQRCGFPEVIYAPGKPLSVLLDIVGTIVERRLPLLVTRVEPDVASVLCEHFADIEHNSVARTVRSTRTCADLSHARWPVRRGVVVISAGSSDQSVAEEACETLAWMGIQHQTIRDVGVAGPQRLLRHLDTLRGAAAIVVIAGMEGALPSVIGGYVNCPIFAVPTSVGYGANFNGISALLAMLNSCAANVAVCNIDAGFKGAYLAGLVAREPIHSE
jgi:NCAIR mutase (PurE)-related protein